MIVKYITFLIGIIWSYSIIKTQSVFSKKAGIIFKIFITNISWLTLIAACYFGYKNFSIKLTIFGVIIGVLLVNMGFYFSKKFINEKFDKRKNPQGKEYYWLTGEFINEDSKNDTDEHALNSGYISIVPVKHDLTDYDSMKRIKDWHL